MAETGRKRSISWPRRILKVLSWTVFIIVCLVVLAVLSTQTRPVKNWIRDYAVSTANESLTGTLSVGRLDGNLYSNLELNDVALTMESDTVVRITSIRLSYDLWALFDKTVQIDSFAIDSPWIKLVQKSDSSWNLSSLLVEETSDGEPKDTGGAFDYAVVVDEFILSEGSASIVAFDSLVPSRIDSLNVGAAARYTLAEQTLELSRFELRTHQPDFKIARLTTNVTIDSAVVDISDLILETARNRVTASASLHSEDFARSVASLRGDSVDVTEFSFLQPLHPDLDPVMNLVASLERDTLKSAVDITSGRQAVEIALSANHVSSLMDSSTTVPLDYDGRVNLTRVNLARWANNAELDMILNGEITLSGRGIDPDSAELRAVGRLKNCLIKEQPAKTLAFDLRYARDSASGSLTAGGVFGQADINGHLAGITGTPAYDLKMILKDFDLSKLVFIDSLPTNLNLKLSVQGTGLSPDSLRGEAKLAMSPSSVMGITIDSSRLDFGYTADGLRVDTAMVVTDALTIDAAGTVSRDKTGKLRYNVNLTNGSILAGLSDSAIISGTGLIRGQAEGNIDSLDVTADFTFDSLVLSQASIARLQGEMTARYSDSAIAADGWVDAFEIETDFLSLDSVALEARHQDNYTDLNANLYLPNGLATQAELGVGLDSLIRVVVRGLNIKYGEIEWAGGSDSTVVEALDSSTYAIRRLRLAADAPHNDSQQVIEANGMVSLTGESDITAIIENLALSPLTSLMDLNIGGILSAQLNLTGMADSPVASGQVAIADGNYEDYEFHHLAGDVDFRSQRAGFALNFKPIPAESLTVAGSIPVAFSLSNSADQSSTSDTIRVDISANRLPLDILKAAGYYVEQADGYISLDLSVSNTIDNPYVTGSARVRDGAIKMPEYGISYRDIEAGLSFDGDIARLDSLIITDNGGRMNLSGQVEFDSSIISGQISSSRVDLASKDFFIVRHRDYEVQITSEASLEGTQEEPRYSGKITINRSRFYLPAFMEEGGPDALDTANLPMLVVATRSDTANGLDSAAINAGDAASTDSVRMAFMQNLRGNLKVVIPRNTWIKSPDLRLELSGDIDVVKNGPEFELFGTISVVRGHYDLYGKRFKIREGQLTFQGGSDYVASLDIEADYVFRTPAREKKTLKLDVGGTSESPVLNFALDGAQISEGDAVSYILFGRSLDQLSQGQRSSISSDGESGSVAGSVAASLLAGQLSKALGSTLNLDVIEIKAQGDLQSAAIVVGKYLTPDLFMSYQRSFGTTSDDDLEPEKVTLEYQLTRLIYLQLTEGDAEDAGFDVIFKLQRE